MQLQPLSEDYFSSQVLKMNIQSEFWKSNKDELQKKGMNIATGDQSRLHWELQLFSQKTLMQSLVTATRQKR